MKHVIVTIDGPAGSGKSTIAAALAAGLGFTYLDTGALYRGAALAIEVEGSDINDPDQLARILADTTISLSNQKVLVNGNDVTAKIRSHHISELASQISVHPQVRAALMNIQRSFARTSSVVAEGRDTGSIVFPEADVKIFLDASMKERAKRRHQELASLGVDITFKQVFKDMEIRDMRDRTRQTSPLIIPRNAIVVDTTQLRLEEVIDIVLCLVRDKLSYK
ncbi:MAG: (d)CMP kinase [Deltaproteobacteria bacterium]|nr:(d)CMP kinase [Deltaproteobacteria bacterium]